VDESRRSWRREDTTAELPEPAVLHPSSDAVSDRTALAKLLTELPARQCAVIVLRFYCDMSVAETADLLGVSEGTVKSQSARGLELLRLAAHHHAVEEDQ